MGKQNDVGGVYLQNWLECMNVTAGLTSDMLTGLSLLHVHTCPSYAANTTPATRCFLPPQRWLHALVAPHLLAPSHCPHAGPEEMQQLVEQLRDAAAKGEGTPGSIPLANLVKLAAREPQPGHEGSGQPGEVVKIHMK